MYSNNLNGAYEYESERRNDERRAAAESWQVHSLLGERKLLVSPRVVVVLVIAAIILWHVL